MSEFTVAETWLAAYKIAWETQSVRAITALFTSDGEYWETPFLVHKGTEQIAAYWAAAPLQQKDIQFSHSLLAHSPKGFIAHWHATFSIADTLHELDGVFLIDLDSDGRCCVLREWWHSRNHC